MNQNGFCTQLEINKQAQDEMMELGIDLRSGRKKAAVIVRTTFILKFMRMSGLKILLEPVIRQVVPWPKMFVNEHLSTRPFLTVITPNG